MLQNLEKFYNFQKVYKKIDKILNHILNFLQIQIFLKLKQKNVYKIYNEIFVNNN